MGQTSTRRKHGSALEWKPGNWTLWNTPQEPDDEASVEVLRRKLEEVLEAGREDDKTLAEKLREPNP